jgi:hypothetical protein
MEKPVLDLLSLISRIPYTMDILNRGTEHAWAAGFIYAIGQMKGLFTRGREEGMKREKHFFFPYSSSKNLNFAIFSPN